MSDRGITRREVTTDAIHDFEEGSIEKNPHPNRYFEKDVYKDGLAMNSSKNYKKHRAKEESMRRMDRNDNTEYDYSFKPDRGRDYDSEWLKEVNDKWIKNKNKKKK